MFTRKKCEWNMSSSVCLTLLKYVPFFVPGPPNYDTRNQNSWALFHLRGKTPQPEAHKLTPLTPKLRRNLTSLSKPLNFTQVAFPQKSKNFMSPIHIEWNCILPTQRLLSIYMWPATYAHQLMFSKGEYGQTKAYTITMYYHAVRSQMTDSETRLGN